MKNKGKKWIVWLYAAVLCTLLFFGLAYCFNLGNQVGENVNEGNVTIQQSANAEDAEVLDLDTVSVPLSDVSGDE